MFDSEIYLTTSQMTFLFQITRQGLSRWVERGLPKTGRNQFPLKECLEWIKRNVWFVGVGKQGMAEEKLKFQKARSEREELRAAKEKGELICRQDAVDGWAILVRNCYQGFSNLPRRLSETLVSMDDAKDAEVILRSEIRKILEELSLPLRKGERREKKDRDRCRTIKRMEKVLASERRESKTIEEEAAQKS